MRLAIGAAALSSALFAFAFVAAPNSCEWGTDAYAVAGLATLVALFVWPIAAGSGRPLAARASLGVLFAMGGVGVWLCGLFVANVRIVCRLF